MKHVSRGVLAVVCLVMITSGVVAQDEPTGYIFGVYYKCDQNREAVADLMMEHIFGPIYDRHVQEGNLTGWGWLSHNVGGDWRKLNYFAANSIDKLLDTRTAIIEEIQSQNAVLGREMTSVCPDHDDFIWANVSGSSPPGELLADRGEASYSTYYFCNTSKQERADEIVEQAYAPVLNRLVSEGKLNSWLWAAHVVGGKYRRLMSYTGADHKSLIGAVNAMGVALDADYAELSEEFTGICGTHDDYLWSNVISRP
jgi:hypothetical protein